MNMLRVSIVLAALMGLASVGGLAARPPVKAPGSAPRYVLEEVVPQKFVDWQLLDEPVQVVNPQTKQILDKLYSQILTRTYVNSAGYRIMLSLAYGDDQRGDLQAHKPEVCYPAQGFALHSNIDAPLSTPFGTIDARRLSTSLGQRKEPVTYWFTVGDKPIKTKLEQRMVEMRLGLTGQVPDGLLFRVSSVDEATDRAFGMQNAFVTDLLGAVSAQNRLRLSGLEGKPGPA